MTSVKLEIETKKCKGCGEIKPINCFAGRRNHCRDCINQQVRDRMDGIIGPRPCRTCKKVKNPEEFSKRNTRCKICESEYQRNYYHFGGGNVKIKERCAETKEEKRVKNHDKLYGGDVPYIIKYMMRQVKKRAKEFGRAYDLDYHFLMDKYINQDQCCALTGIPFRFEKNGEFKCRPFAPSIDRIDTKKGYTKDNIRFICVSVNMALNEFGIEIFDLMCRSYLSLKNDNLITC